MWKNKKDIVHDFSVEFAATIVTLIGLSRQKPAAVMKSLVKSVQVRCVSVTQCAE